jgi:hypothetical protein
MKRIVCFIMMVVFGSAFSIMCFAQAGTDATNGQLEGTVADAAEGVPIPYAYVLIHANVGEKEIVAKVNSRGKFVFSLEPGLYDVLVAATGFAPTCRKLEITRGKTIEFNSRLEPDEEHLQHSQ